MAVSYDVPVLASTILHDTIINPGSTVLKQLEEAGWDHEYMYQFVHGAFTKKPETGVLHRIIKNPALLHLSPRGVVKNSAFPQVNPNSVITPMGGGVGEITLSQNEADCILSEKVYLENQSFPCSEPMVSDVSCLPETCDTVDSVEHGVNSSGFWDDSAVFEMASGVVDHARSSCGVDVYFSDDEIEDLKYKALACFNPCELPTLKAVRGVEKSLVFALDTEFFYTSRNSRLILTWQFCFVEPNDDSKIHQVIFYSCNGKRVGLGRSISYIIERFKLAEAFGVSFTVCKNGGYPFVDTRRWIVPTVDMCGCWVGYKGKPTVEWKYCKSIDEAVKSCGDKDFLAAYQDLLKTKNPSAYRLRPGNSSTTGLAGYRNIYTDYHRKKRYIPVTVLCHFGPADLGAFDYADGSYETDVMVYLTEVQKGLVSKDPICMNPRLYKQNRRFYPLALTVRDTMCHAPAGMRGLDNLGDCIGVSKLELPDGYDKECMDVFLAEDPVDFLEYAARDTVVTIGYAGQIYGWNSKIPMTASSAGLSVGKSTIMEKHSDIMHTTADFDRIFRGMYRKNLGKDDNCDGTLHMHSEMSLLEDSDVEIIYNFARDSYRGGFNSCSTVGWIEGVTHDLDLESAYPTAMSLVYDVDWCDPNLIVTERLKQDAQLQWFKTPMDPCWAYVDGFEFPEDCVQPCIPLTLEDKLVYCRTLGKKAGVWVTGIEIWLALKLGAKVHVKRFFEAKILAEPDTRHESHFLYEVVKAFVEDRITVKSHLELYPEYKIYELLLKLMVNSIYGKIAQAVLEKHTWNAFKQKMEELSGSSMSSPAHCSMITAIVRCVLIAAINELHLAGYKVYSTTTDGFITDAPLDFVNNLDLCGLSRYLHAARYALSGDSTIWSEKHTQDGFYNLCTRGNIAPNVAVDGMKAGVCAHNSYRSPYKPDSVDDRRHCLDIFLTRTGKVKNNIDRFASFRDTSGKEHRIDFCVVDAPRQLSMDFDFKRKPVEESVYTQCIVVFGNEYEVAHVDTAPYETPEEFKLWYDRSRYSKCLRTEYEWHNFFGKMSLLEKDFDAFVGKKPKTAAYRIGDFEKKRIMTVVTGCRLGLWSIAPLDRNSGLTVAEKIEWINGFNKSNRAFTESDWKNCSRQKSQEKMLPIDAVQDLLDAMGAVMVSAKKSDVEVVVYE